METLQVRLLVESSVASLTRGDHATPMTMRNRIRRIIAMQSVPALLVSVGLHALIVVLAFSLPRQRSTIGPSIIRDKAGVIGNQNQQATGGGATAIAPPLSGPSLDPAAAAEFLGRYRYQAPGPIEPSFDIRLINDGEMEHWSLAIVEDRAQLSVLVPVAPDTFVFQLAPKQRVVFRRSGDSVTAVSLRRTRDTSWAVKIPK